MARSRARLFSEYTGTQATTDFIAGQFSIGRYTGGIDPGTFTLFNIFSEDIAGTGMDFFESGTTDPNIIFNDTGAPKSIANFTVQPNGIAFGPFNGPTVLRFTAPTTGTYSVNANFLGIQTVNSDARALVFVGTDTTAEFDDTADTTDGATFTNGSLNLTAGQTVDFVVAGSNVGSGNRTTSLTASLTVVPEPTTAALFAVGGLALLRRKRRV